jgi:Fe2+ or Zn2+ uptake regulation protein
MKQAKDVLMEKNIQPSFHRLKILKLLTQRNIHPTSEEIYLKLFKEIPTLSRTTVYNTLKLFCEKRIISEVTISGKEMRYEYAEEPHIHFKCRVCGNIYDVDKNCALLDKKILEGHKIEEYHIYLKGVCKHCRGKKRPENKA